MQNLKSPAIHTNIPQTMNFQNIHMVATKYDYKFKMLINDTMYFCILSKQFLCSVFMNI